MPEADRFKPSKRVLLIDRMMNRFIRLGGFGVIVAVLGILVFIGGQVVPLFKGARVTEFLTVAFPKEAEILAVGMDEWGELPFAVLSDGNVVFQPVEGGSAQTLRYVDEAEEVAHAVFNSRTQTILAGLKSGKVLTANVSVRKDFSDGGAESTLRPEIEEGKILEMGIPEGAEFLGLDYSLSDNAAIAAVLYRAAGETKLQASTYSRKKTLLGAGKFELDGTVELTEFIEGTPERVIVNGNGDSVLVTVSDGRVFYIFKDSGNFEQRQVFQPFADGVKIDSIDYVLGYASVSLTSDAGSHVIYSLYRENDDSLRLFGKTKTLPDLPEGASTFAASKRNKSILLTAGSTASLRYTTSSSVRWEKSLAFEPRFSAINRKNSRIAMVAPDNVAHIYELDDPHPESGWKAFFGKVWYEGSPEPDYTWQSTGGSDSFEPKLSLIPLIIGTLKGTLYAMLFAVPIALLAAVYTSQFLSPGLKSIIKPAMEIMASLPSVVLGFMGALWLAPLIDTKTVSLLLIVIFIPAASFLAGYLWSRLPIRFRRQVKPGYEFLIFAPFLLAGFYILWHAGPAVERMFFTVTTPEGNVVADFRRWWTEVTGLRYEQRNCVIIGIMMGFAVIPIIFTITEDSMSSVPEGLRTASLALGASRWQTAWRVVLPTASPGIFSAVMIGLGRAVGETMIVVMATGNTPITEWNIFSGMRTLSANIAVELPEAPHHSTLYRTLFLGAVLLFLMTFFVNSLAEILRQHLREKYKTV